MTVVASRSGDVRAIRNGSRSGRASTSVATLIGRTRQIRRSRQPLAQRVEQALAAKTVGIVARQAELVGRARDLATRSALVQERRVEGHGRHYGRGHEAGQLLVQG